MKRLEYSEIMVRYGELSTKGKNRKSFIMQLAQNVRSALSDYPNIKIKADRDRMHLLLNGEDSHAVIEKLTEEIAQEPKAIPGGSARKAKRL